MPRYQLIRPTTMTVPIPRSPVPTDIPPRDALASRSSSTLSLGRKSSVRFGTFLERLV
jgi:hypothetical protein